MKATIPVGVYPFTMARDPYRRTLYVCNYFSDSISVIDEATNTVTDTISLPYIDCVGLLVDPIRGTVYASEG